MKDFKKKLQTDLAAHEKATMEVRQRDDTNEKRLAAYLTASRLALGCTIYPDISDCEDWEVESRLSTNDEEYAVLARTSSKITLPAMVKGAGPLTASVSASEVWAGRYTSYGYFAGIGFDGRWGDYYSQNFASSIAVSFSKKETEEVISSYACSLDGTSRFSNLSEPEQGAKIIGDVDMVLQALQTIQNQGKVGN